MRVIAPDVGGGFGLKINVYAEEVAVAALSKMVGRPVKFLADRLESFVSDIHVRDHKITARMAVDAAGKITAMSVDDISSIGAYGMPMRFNITESMMLVTNTGAAYKFPNYRARTRNAFVNKPLIGMYRGVGIPLSTIVTEVLTDMAADEARNGYGRLQAAELSEARGDAVRLGRRQQARQPLVRRLPRPAGRGDGLRAAAAGTGRAAQEGHLSRHRHRDLCRAHGLWPGVLRADRRRRSRCRTAAPSGSSRPASCAA